MSIASAVLKEMGSSRLLQAFDDRGAILFQTQVDSNSSLVGYTSSTVSIHVPHYRIIRVFDEKGHQISQRSDH